MRIAIAAASILALVGTASAATVKVPQDQPTIQAGVLAAGTGDTVSVSKGVYFENVVVGNPGIRIVGKGAILDGNILGVDGNCLTINAADVVVQGITFRNGIDQIVMNANGAQVLKCTFLDAGSDGISGTAGGVTITSSKFQFMSNSAVDLAGADNTASKCSVARGGNRGFLFTGDGNRVESCTFLRLDDNGAAQVVGNNAVISKNKVSFADADCFRADGTGAVVELNKGDRCDARLVQVNGDGAVVQKNTATYCRGGILVNGNTAMILSNKISNNTSTDAISVNGDAFTVTGNTVATTWDDADGISAGSTVGTGTIEGNKVSDTAGYGFNLNTIISVVVRNDSATRCGEDGRGGFSVVGDNNTLEGLKVADAEGPGILVSGNGNDSANCSVKGASTDGIQVAAGAGNTFDGCSATSCGGEGFDNRGTGTVVNGGSFTKNRLDVANDVTGGATIPAGLATVKFGTGGATTQPQVD